jgi:hypothetical protein
MSDGRRTGEAGTPEAMSTATPADGPPRRGFAAAVKPPVSVLFVDRYRTGRLRLDTTTPAARWLVRLGIVFLIGLNLALLYASRGGWRHEPLVSVLPGNQPLFAPQSLIPFTLLALGVGWTLVLWGAAMSSTLVRLAVAIAFLLVNTDLAGTIVIPHARAAALQYGGPIARVAYFTAPGLLVAAAIAGVVPRWWRLARPVVLTGLVLASIALFGSLVWINDTAQRRGLLNVVPSAIGSSVTTGRGLIFPVLLGSAVEVLELGYSAVSATAIPLRQLPAAAARAVLVALIALKLALELVAHLSEWATFMHHRLFTVVCSVSAVAFLAVLGLVLRRPLVRPDVEGAMASAPATEEERVAEEDDEALIYAGAVSFALPLIAVVTLLTVGTFVFEYLGQHTLPNVVRALTLDLPADRIQRVGNIVTGAGLLLAGLYLLRRRRRSALAAAVVILGSWALVLAVPAWWHVTASLNPVFMDIVITLAVVVFAAVRWRSLDTAIAVALTALVAFSWLASTRGGYLTKLLGSFLPAAAIVTVVTGTLWALLTDSAFAAGSSRMFPDIGRPLLWVGLLLTAATLTNWAAVTHDFDITQPVTSGGFVHLGLPLAAWWVFHRRFRAAPDVAGPAPSEAPPADAEIAPAS